MEFKQLQLSVGLLEAIEKAGFTEPTEIQASTIPLVLAGKDVIAGSATGSGKTLAFGAPIIDKITKWGGVQALVLAPTRELASQVATTLKTFSLHAGLNVVELAGGSLKDTEVKDLRNANIVVGTPGRIIDHLHQRSLYLQKIKFLVLDEADRMLDLGFIKEVETIINACSKQRQTLLFSATINKEVSYIAKKYMQFPVKVQVENQVDPNQLYQTYYDVPRELKFSLLVHLLKKAKGIVMIFCNTRRNVDRLCMNLNYYGINSRALHAGLAQDRRNENMQSFQKQEANVLVCTDVAARGIDIKNITHVYNYDLPKSSTDYIHRIGRTARAGENGTAVSFVSEGDHGEIRQIARSGQLNIEKLSVPKMLVLSNTVDTRTEIPHFRRGHGKPRGNQRRVKNRR